MEEIISLSFFKLFLFSTIYLAAYKSKPKLINKIKYCTIESTHVNVPYPFSPKTRIKYPTKIYFEPIFKNLNKPIYKKFKIGLILVAIMFFKIIYK